MNQRIERLERLVELREKGALSGEEFLAEKAKLLGSTASTQASGVQEESITRDAARGSEESDPARIASKDREAEASLGHAPTVSSVSDADPQEEPASRSDVWRKRLKWPSIIVAVVGGVVLLAKFGMGLAILVALLALITHGYAINTQSREAKEIAIFGYVGAVGLFVAGWVASAVVPASLGSRAYEAADFEDELALCLQSGAMHGQVIERLSAKSNVAKKRMDWEVSMGQDRMIAGQLYGRDLQAITRSFKADLDRGASSVLKDCGNAKRQIESNVSNIDGIAAGTLSVCYSVASDLEKLAKLGLAKNASVAADNLISWPDLKPRFEKCATNLNLTNEQLIGGRGESSQ